LQLLGNALLFTTFATFFLFDFEWNMNFRWMW
jgi:hypothetical protein